MTISKPWLLGLGAVVLGSSLMLAGCASTKPSEYANEKPVLDVRQYFSGTLDGHGMLLNRSGKVTRRFYVEIVVTTEGDTVKLNEDFTWSDGEKQKRVWTLRQKADGGWTGTAGDVVGEADGVLSGNALRWNYVLQVPVDGKTYDINFDDWMFLIDDKVMLNRATMSKFGFRVGELVVSFTKR